MTILRTLKKWYRRHFNIELTVANSWNNNIGLLLGWDEGGWNVLFIIFAISYYKTGW